MILIKDITKLIKDNTSKFRRYADGNLTYSVQNPIDGNDYEYDIPVRDTKGGVFEMETKSIYHMRWIRKSIETKTLRISI
jgi:hypothetical protein